MPINEKRLMKYENVELVNLLFSTRITDISEAHRSILTILMSKRPLPDEILKKIKEYIEISIRMMGREIKQLKELVQIQNEELVTPLVMALKSKVTDEFSLVIQAIGILSGVNTKILLTQLNRISETNDISAAKDYLEKLQETLRVLDAALCTEIGGLLTQFFIELPQMKAEGRSELDIDLILSLVQSTDVDIKDLALAGVGDLVTKKFLKILVETYSSNNPTVQLISLQSLERIKSLLQLPNVPSGKD
jgi:hypothetical protein